MLCLRSDDGKLEFRLGSLLSFGRRPGENFQKVALVTLASIAKLRLLERITCMSTRKPGRASSVTYWLVAVILLGSYVLLNDLQEDRSATMAPNLTFGR